MPTTLQQRRPKEETARLGEEIYARLTRTVFGPAEYMKYGAIAVDSGNYEVDLKSHAAITRMKAREPDADIWLVKIGARVSTHFRSPR